METVALAVAQVIEDVNGAGGEAKGEEGDGDAQDRGRVDELAREERGEDDERIFGPLRETERARDDQRAGAARPDLRVWVGRRAR